MSAPNLTLPAFRTMTAMEHTRTSDGNHLDVIHSQSPRGRHYEDHIHIDRNSGEHRQGSTSVNGWPAPRPPQDSLNQMVNEQAPYVPHVYR